MFTGLSYGQPEFLLHLRYVCVVLVPVVINRIIFSSNLTPLHRVHIMEHVLPALAAYYLKRV